MIGWRKKRKVPAVDPWQYGRIANGMRCRRHRNTGRVEFMLWMPGQHGHKNGYWHVVGEGWPETFVPDIKIIENNC